MTRVLLLLLVLLAGCVRREGRNSDCRWIPAPPSNALDLSGDLEFAEELAIRYMDAHVGPGNPAATAQAKNRCLGQLLEALGKDHGLTAQAAFRSFGQRSAAVDFAMALPFLAAYLLAADLVVRRLLRRYDSRDDRTTVAVMIVLASLTFAAVGLLVGQQWSALAESIRVGTTHLSNRGFRLPASQHPVAVWLSGAAIFAGLAWLRVRGAIPTAAP